jgi:hypothetical protein
MMSKSLTLAAFILLLAVVGSPVYAQTGTPPGSAPGAARLQSELGVAFGIGSLSYTDDEPGNRTNISANACLFCGRRALVVEYSHWTKPRASYPTGYRSSDTFTSGLRFQGQRRVRPFFDVGVAVAGNRYQRASTTTTITTAGAYLGVGATIPFAHSYVRVGTRMLLMTESYFGADLAIGAGFRF